MASNGRYAALGEHSTTLPPPRSRVQRGRRAGSYLILTIFLAFVLALGLFRQFEPTDDRETYDDPVFTEKELEVNKAIKSPKWSSLSQYGVTFRNISKSELGLENHGNRVIIVGDIHGQHKSVQKLLKKLKYSPTSDRLIHVGDIVAKGTLKGSLAVLDQLTAANTTGVRGNHDQKVIEWRAWFDWVESYPHGAEWLAVVERLSKSAFENAEKLSGKFPIPKGWKWRSDHWRIARNMSDAHYKYLLSLPLVIHLPTLHAHVVHAGLLPLDPNRSWHNSHQPLAHLPELIQSSQLKQMTITAELRHAQEVAVVHDIPQNRDPWVKLNMRSIFRNGKITESASHGSPWSDLWNSVVKQCGGFDLELAEEIKGVGSSTKGTGETRRKPKAKPLPCYPFTVIYGHAASRGLDLKRWSKGIDSGCVYGRRLSALVFTDNAHDPSTYRASRAEDEDGDEAMPKVEAAKETDDEDPDDNEILRVELVDFGKSGKAKLVSVSC